MANVVNAFIQLSVPPSRTEDFDGWLNMGDAVAFLKQNAKHEEFIVYGVCEHAFVHAILIPASLANPPDTDDLLRWQCNAHSSWGVEVHYSEAPVVSIAPPLSGTGSKTLDSGEQLVFARTFEGRLRETHYHELLQKFAHIFGLHFMEERNAYCRLDRHGDIEDVVRIVGIPEGAKASVGTIVTVKRAFLDDYLLLTESIVVRTFDFTRYESSGFSGWSEGHDNPRLEDEDIFYDCHVERERASYIRGCQIVRPTASRESLLRRYGPLANDSSEQYESFIAHDWKNGKVDEISCAPGQTTNYFTESNLPFELSPAFFRPEVLSKYKADSEKYVLAERSVSCRGGWYLKGLDINEAGQVHAYLVDLRNLPHEEELHWKSYNERPKGPISDRAKRADFEGCWDTEYNPLDSLKEAIGEISRRQVPWWVLRSETLIDKVNYPITASFDEWANDLMLLDQLLVEGFEAKWLRNKATDLGRCPDATFGSLKLVEECLIAIQFSDEDARSIVSPLRTLHELRSKLRGHASGKDTVTMIRKQALTTYQTYRKHFRALCGQCDESLRRIANAFTTKWG
jgi:hypothetical protein